MMNLPCPIYTDLSGSTCKPVNQLLPYLLPVKCLVTLGPMAKGNRFTGYFKVSSSREREPVVSAVHAFTCYKELTFANLLPRYRVRFGPEVKSMSDERRGLLTEPIGPTEFSYGRGVQAPPDEGAVPTGREQLRALWRNDQPDRNLDPGAVPTYDDYVRE